MGLQEIEQLLESYLEGKTTLREEGVLRDYFKTHEQLPAHLEDYRMLFNFFGLEAEQTYQNHVLLPKRRSYKWLTIGGSVAAIIIVLLTLLPFATTPSPPAGQQQEVIQSAKGLFMIMGSAVEEGKQNLNYLEELKSLDLSDRQGELDTMHTYKNDTL